MLTPMKVAGDAGASHAAADSPGGAHGAAHVPADGQSIDARPSDDGALPADDHDQSDEPARAPAMRFLDLGRVGTASYGDPSPPDHDAFPHAFTDGGQTQTVKWAGGGGAGAHGNQGAGTLQKQKQPSFFRATPKGDAFIREGTGEVDVVRSWTGVADGDQGNGYFLTAAAAARINQHETLHVVSSKTHYDAEIEPLLARVRDFTLDAAVAKALLDPPTPRSIPALQKIIDWPATIQRFKTKDTADNKPKGTVDTADLATGTYPVDAGPGTVSGKQFQHRVRLPSEANPPP